MKSLTVTIRLEMKVPDDWQLVQTSEGIDVLDIGHGQYLDLTFEPMTTEDIDGTWTSSENSDFVNSIIDTVLSEGVSYEFTGPSET